MNHIQPGGPLIKLGKVLPCDGSGPHYHAEVRRLELGSGSGIILCRACFDREIAWRKERNKTLGYKCKFPLPKWETLEIYSEK